MKEIEVHVHTRDGEEPRVITINEEAPIEELLRQVSAASHAELYLVVDEEDEPRHRHHRLCDCGIKHGHHVHCHPKVIHYTVDGEAQETTKHKLTAEEIMKKAGVDPKTHYLILLKPHGGEVSYKGHPETIIHLHEGMKFITASLGPTPVS
jgi:hypothetical protein